MKKQDRVINRHSETSGVRTSKVYRNGNLYDSNPTTYPISQIMHRVRTPSGGTKLPLREKPFENGVLNVKYLEGTLLRSSGGYNYVDQGTLTGAYNMFGGNTLQTDMGHPMRTRTIANVARTWYPPSVNADLLSQAEVKCLNKLKGKAVQDEIEFGLVWAERSETVRLFADAGVGLWRLCVALKRGDVAGAVDVLLNDFRFHKARRKNGLPYARMDMERDVAKGIRSTKKLADRLSNITLAFNLGISPLLKDLDAAGQRLRTGLLTADWDIKSVSRYSRTRQDVDRDSWGTTRVEQTYVENHGYTVVLIACPLFSTRALLGQLGLTNLPSLAYELTKSSFILDYFAAVGPWLKAIEVPSLFEFKDGSWTQRVERLVTLNVWQGAVKMQPGTASLNYVKRTLYAKFPIPLPPLSWRERQLSDKQVLNTGLVAIQRVRGMLVG